MKTPDQIAAAGPNPQHSSPRATGATILLIDDEEMITRLLERQLGKWGYQTVACNTIAAALAIVESNQPIDLVVTDYVMPHMKGIEFAGVIRRNRPDLPIILCTGNDHALQKEDLVSLGIVALLQKPMQAASLLQVVRAALLSSKP